MLRPAPELVRLGDLDCVLLTPAGWVPPDGLVVLNHGFGAPGDDLVALADYVPAPRVAWAFPAAPIALPSVYGDGRAWWMIDMMRLQEAAQRGDVGIRMREVPEGLELARAKLGGMLDALRARTGVPDDRVVIGGFSQGAMLALDVVLTSERAFAGVALMSGTYVAEAVWAPRMAARRGLRVVQSHGKADPILPFASSELLRDALREAGLDVTWVPFAGGHAIPPQVLEAVGELIRSTLTQGP